MATAIRAILAVFLLVSGIGTAAAARESGGRTILVLDASGSMWGQIKGKAKIAIAREVIAKLVKDLNPEMELGLSAYGHRRKGDCGDIEQLIPVSRLDPTRIIAAVDRLKPKGKTPLSDAVRRAARELKYQEEKATVVLVSDGKETCDADPCALGRELAESGAHFTVHVIGFDVGKEERHGLQCLAENTGGVYLSADDAESLASALGTAVTQAATGSPPSTVLVPVLVEGGERAHVGVRWTVSEADAKGAPGKKVYSILSDVVVKALPTGRYVVEATYANAAGRKLIDIDAEAPGKHPVALNAGLLRLEALKKAGGGRYRGAPYLFWSVHPVGADGKAARKYLVKDDGNPREFLLAPGRYRVRAEAGVVAVAAEVTVKAGETAAKTVVLDSGAVNLTALVREGGAPYKGAPYLFWSIHPLGPDGRPAKKHLVKDDGNPKKFVLPPGRYVARAEAGVVEAETGFEVKAGETTRNTLAFGAGRARVAFVDGPGGQPRTGVGVWYVHRVGADGTPAKKYLTYADRNPYDFLLPAGRYLARATIAKARFEGTFEVAPGDTKKVEIVAGKR